MIGGNEKYDGYKRYEQFSQLHLLSFVNISPCVTYAPPYFILLDLITILISGKE
jgi:hypothetical protein